MTIDVRSLRAPPGPWYARSLHALVGSRLRRALLLTALSSLALQAGCPEEDDLPGQRGDLGVGNFVYKCVSVTDTACADGGVTPAVLPQAVAVGGRFDMTFAVRSGPLPLVISPSATAMRRDSGAFEVLQAGTFSLLAVTGNSEVIDIMHMRGEPVAEVRVQQANELPVSRLTLSPGQMVAVAAVPFDAQGRQLGGALAYQWRSADERHLTVETLPNLSSVRVRAVAAGTTTLLLTVAGQTFMVQVQVGNGSADGGTTPLDGGQQDASPIDAGRDAQLDATQADAGVVGGDS